MQLTFPRVVRGSFNFWLGLPLMLCRGVLETQLPKEGRQASKNQVLISIRKAVQPFSKRSLFSTGSGSTQCKSTCPSRDEIFFLPPPPLERQLTSNVALPFLSFGEIKKSIAPFQARKFIPLFTCRGSSLQMNAKREMGRVGGYYRLRSCGAQCKTFLWGPAPCRPPYSSGRSTVTQQRYHSQLLQGVVVWCYF